MSNRFAPGCRCCGCYRTMIVICVYDESQPVYTSGNQYQQDYDQWVEFIDDIKRSKIRVGVLIPQGTEEGVKNDALPFPKDTDRDVILTKVLSSQNPRVQAHDIVDFFEEIREALDPGDPDSHPLGRSRGPQLLLFCLDNSGSITTNVYADELADAKAQLENLYPKMDILDDISNSGERWLRDSYEGCKDRTCG